MRFLLSILNLSKQFTKMEGKRTKQSEGPLITEHCKLGGSFVLKSKPEFVGARMKMFDTIKKRIDEIYMNAEKPQITVQLKDGKEVKGQAFITTPYDVAKGISRSLADNSIVAKIKYTKRYDSPLGKGVFSAEVEDQTKHDFELVDLTRPLEGDCSMELVNFDDNVGKEVFWHSSAHLLGQSLENHYGAWLCHGPPLDSGFFYDSYVGNYRVSQEDYQKIEAEVKKYASQKQPYERIVLSKKEALEMFSYNPFKTQLIEKKIPQQGLTSAYRCGDLIDLCTGPHIPSADKVKGFKVTKNSSAYWLGNKDNDDLQRVYAIAFPKQALLEEYLKMQDELAKRDHRHIGPKQNLFNLSTLSPGCAFFFQQGTVIYNRLMELMRSEYRIRGYGQVLSPNLYNAELWKMSGHYFKYRQNIFFIKEQNQEHGLKPMNCPGHCIMFDMEQKSYRDLPYRVADFGVLHRNEVHGALTGLTRVRRFQQDDAHIFCMNEQIQQEILGVLDLIDYIYSVFGFKYILELSTRPQNYLGKIEDWNHAEAQLKQALDKFGKQYKINPGDGAFYGPKIDLKLFDVFGREHQCGTVQLDFQLPVRFNLQYRSKHKQQEQKDIVQHKHEKKQKHKLTAEEIEARRMQKKKQKEQKQEKEEIKQQQVSKKQKGKVQEVQHLSKEEDMQQMEQRYSKEGNLKNGFERPVIIHRAIYGSFQRFIAILCEQTGGKWDFWLSPRQLRIIPIGQDAKQFSQKVYNSALLQNYCVSIDDSGDKLDKKIRNAQIDSYNFIGVIGPEQIKNQTINLRRRDEKEEFAKSIPDMLAMFSQLKPPKSNRRKLLQQQSFK